MSLLDKLTRQAFDTARTALPKLREPQADGAVALNRFAEVETLRFASGLGVTDISPKPRATTWTQFCEGVADYAHNVIGPTEADKKANSKYVLAGEVAKAVQGVGHTVGLGSTEITSWRTDVQVCSLTMLILDCDAPVAASPLCRALDELHLAHCVTPTWASTPAEPRWRCFMPIAPLTVETTGERAPDGELWSRKQARCRYAWLAGLLAELADLPTVCPACGGMAQPEGKPCKVCLATQTFRFDLSCWNYSRLHFLGGRPTAETSMTDRHVIWSRGYGLDTLAWAAASGFDDWWAEARRQLAAEQTLRLMRAGSEGDGYGASDAGIAAALANCQHTLVERVRRAALYIGSPDFPASSKAPHDPRYGHDDLMRACSAVVSGFLVPIEHDGEEWALRVIETAFNPRCTDLNGEPYPWQSREIRKKLADVRSSGATPGSLLSRPSREGEPFFVVRADGSQGHAADMAGVYSASGDQMASAGRSGAMLDLSIDAARSCPIRPYDPEALPDGFRPRRIVVPIALGMPTQMSQTGAVARQQVGQVAVAQGLGGGLGGLGGPSLRSLPGGLSGGLSGGLAGGLGSRVPQHASIPADADWDEPVIISDTDEAAKRAIVEQMNARFAYVKLPRDAVIVDTVSNAERRGGERAYLTPRGFLTEQQRYPLRLRSFTAKGGEKLTTLNRGELWLGHPRRRQYEEWGFAPERTTAECEAVNPVTGYRRLLNTYQGFAVKPNDRGLTDCPRFAELIDEVIADGSEESSRYIWSFFADIFQRPADKSGVALYFYSPEKGTGKGTLLRAIGLLLGRYYQLVQSADQIAGQWNLHLADKLLVFFDEARGLDSRDKADRLNSLITESEYAASEKFAPLQTCRAYTRYVFASNREDGVSIQVQDRRYAAFKVSPRRRRDEAFFSALWREMYAPCEPPPVSAALDLTRASAGQYRGLSGLMHHLRYGVRLGAETVATEGQPSLGGGVNLRTIPQTRLRMHMMLASLEGVEAFVFSAACQTQTIVVERAPSPGLKVEKQEVRWPSNGPFDMAASDMLTAYSAWARANGQKTVTNIARHLETVFTMSVPAREGAREVDASERHPDFRVYKTTGDLQVRMVTLPSSVSVAAWLAQKYGW